MGWFAGKRNEGDRSRAFLQAIIDMAVFRFGELGWTVAVAEGTSGMGTELEAANGNRYPLHILMARAAAAPREEVAKLVTDHVTALVDAANEMALALPTAELSNAQWRELVRVRIMPREAATAIAATYPRPVADDLVVMLCLDYPTHVSFLGDGSFGTQNLDELAAVGLASVMAEPIDSVTEVEPGIWMIEGESPYIASKVLDLGALVGTVLPDAPYGVVFAVPHRRAILAHVVTGADSMQEAARLATMAVANSGDEAPGGGLSPLGFFWHGGTIDVAARRRGDGTVLFQGRFGDLMERSIL
jgi:hypothetical protein